MEPTVKLKPLFNEIAAAIHDKDGLSDGIHAYDFPERILAIPAGGVELESIAVTSPPNKTSYNVGETFDPTGLVVTATFDNEETFLVDNSDLTFTPSGALAAGTTGITISYQWGEDTKTTTQAITVISVQIYGVEWDGSSTTKWTRTDAAAGFTDPVPYVAGATSYGSPFDSIQPWAGMTRVATDIAGELVKIPKFWYRMTQNGAGLKIQIASEPVEGFSVSPAHTNRGDGKGERDVVYIGRYHCDSGYKSTSGVTPLANITRATARTGIHNLGESIWQADFAMRFTIWLLYLVEFADWNSQACIGYGCGNNSAVANMGYTDSMPYHTGTTQSSRTTYGLGTQYRNIEGLWDNVYDWCDGCYYDSNGMNIILNPNNFSDSNGGTSVGTPSNGYPSAFAVKTNGDFPVFIPTAANGSDSTFSCDYWVFGASNPVLFAGGDFSQYSNRGMFCVGCTGVSSLSAGRGSRLMQLP